MLVPMRKRLTPTVRVLAAGGVIACASILAGCASGTQAIVDSVRQAVKRGDDAVPLDPKFAYLRVTRGRHVGFLYHGSTERSPEGPIEVFYSGSGEVVRLQNGRVVGALGLAAEWRKVSIAPRSWTAIAQGGQQESFVRVRDAMPGYRTGIREDVVVRAIPAPSGGALRGVDPQTLTWFEEIVVSPGASSERLPRARYAVDLKGKELVVYAEQCLAPDLCFTWQRWSAAIQAAVAANAR